MTLPRKPPTGRRYFKADELKANTEAAVTAKPFWEDVKQKDGTVQQRFRVPIRYGEEEGTWTPGVTAYNILISELSDQEDQWIGKAMVFAIEEVKTKQGTRYAKVAHLKANLDSEHPKQDYKCPISNCGAVFSTVQDLQAHLTTHR